jgi:hypothetical protein
MYIVAFNYHHAKGVAKDLNASFNWYQKTIEEEEKMGVKSEKYIPALNNLARFLFSSLFISLSTHSILIPL